MKKLQRIAGALVCLILVSAGPAVADPVSDWNAIAAQVIGGGGRPGPSGILDFAVVHLAIHDAVQAIEHRFEPYHVDIQGASGSKVAAVARAASLVLAMRFPSQATAIDLMYTNYLTANGLMGNDAGVFAGQQAAIGISNLRSLDGSFPAVTENFIGGTKAGEWRPTESFQPGAPPSFSPMAAPWLGAVAPFTLKVKDQFRADAPPRLTSHEYARVYNEVKALGARFNSSRTEAQTQLGYFYADNLVALWFRTLRSIATTQDLSIGDSARLFALASIASADAIITAWSDKRFFNFWRPLTAIREGNNDGNPQTIGDPSWEPLINTPPYSDHTSGANNLAAAMTTILKRFFRSDKMTFVITSNFNPQLLNSNTRTYTRFSHVADDMVEVRIYEGIHFRSADVAARKQGTRVAKQAFGHFLRPLHGDDDDDGDEDR
jgi:hypothetical protein